mmetsp:Transcript_101255/g.179906  ORF Transcript_101255/g.179906 Transcript_101255/m.179906 type:complete len:204 (-) Transcript_101255:170-781(-)
MSILRCTPDSAFTAYYCVKLFDSIGYELYPQDLQDAQGPRGLGIYCTLDLEKAQSSGKDVLIAEFRPSVSGASHSELLLSVPGSAETPGSPEDERWRERNFSGTVFESTELCIRVNTITALYRREWTHPAVSWTGLARIVDRMHDPPLAIDSETTRTDASWAKAMERMKSYGDNQVMKTKEQIAPLWNNQAERMTAPSRCTIS